MACVFPATLPAEIILRILHFITAEIDFSRKDASPSLAFCVPTGQPLRTIQNLRRTCRVLSLFATQILFPILHVSFRQGSISTFEKLTRNPIIAAHARAVVVDLATYPSDMATDLTIFRMKRLAEFDVYFRERNLIRSDDWRYMETEQARRFLKYEFLVADEVIYRDEYDCLSEHLYCDLPMQGELARILRSSHEEFATCRRNQLKCLNSAYTMRQLVAGFSRLACGGKVQFTAKAHRDFAPYVYDAVADNDQRTLWRAMVQPYSWEKIQSQDKKVDLDVIRMLSRLPIALADAGVPVTELWLDCFPLYAGFAQLLSHEKQTASELEWQLQAAFKHLRTFCFGFESMDVAAPRRSPLPDTDMSLMRAYLYAAMASPQLQRVHLQFGAFGIHTDKASSAHNEALFRLGSLLHRCVGRRLERLTLEAVDAKSDELRPFFSRLGPKMHLFELHGVRLLDGLWAPLLHAARQSTARRQLEGPYVFPNSISIATA